MSLFSKKVAINTDAPVDMVGMALQAVASFVASSFSGDEATLEPVLRAAMTHKGAAFLDVIGPCVTFNNHEDSTRSDGYVREHNHALYRRDFISQRARITVDYAPGEVREIHQHDGSVLRLRKLPEDYDSRDRLGAMDYLHACQACREIVTGLLSVDPDAAHLHAHLDTTPTTFNTLCEHELCCGSATLEAINVDLR